MTASASCPPAGLTCALSELPANARARIVSLEPQSSFGARAQDVIQRLKELGFLPGARIRVVGFGLFGRDPVAVAVNGTKFALRRAEASHIRVICEPAASDTAGVTP